MNKKSTYIIIFSFIFIFLFNNCSFLNSNKQIISVIYNNAKAAENKDIKAYMDTIHPNSPIYLSTKRSIKFFFKNYDIKYEIKNIKIIKKTKDEAKVEYIQITKKVKGPRFRNNEAKLLTILKKYKGKWKIYKTFIQDIKYLK